MTWIWSGAATVCILALAFLLRQQRSPAGAARWRTACAIVAGLSAGICAMAAASTADSEIAFLLAGVLALGTIGLAQGHLSRRYG